MKRSPGLDALRSLRLELEAIAQDLRQFRGSLVTSRDILQRVEQFYLSWSALKTNPAFGTVPRKLLQKVEHRFLELVRLTSGRYHKRKYLYLISQIRRLFVDHLTIEVASVPAIDEISERTASRAAETSLFPEIPGLTNDLVPNALYGWTASIKKFLEEHPFDNNVFIMVAYRTRLDPLIRRVERTLRELGLNAVVARDQRLTDDLYNPIACLLCCRYGVAIFDRAEAGQTHNANIVYELAVMHTLKRPCVLLKHHSVRTMPSDFLHRLYEPYKNVAEASAHIKAWWQRQHPE